MHTEINITGGGERDCAAGGLIGEENFFGIGGLDGREGRKRNESDEEGDHADGTVEHEFVKKRFFEAHVRRRIVFMVIYIIMILPRHDDGFSLKYLFLKYKLLTRLL